MSRDQGRYLAGRTPCASSAGWTASERGLREAIVVDIGPEFRGRALSAWSEQPETSTLWLLARVAYHRSRSGLMFLSAPATSAQLGLLLHAVGNGRPFYAESPEAELTLVEVKQGSPTRVAKQFRNDARVQYVERLPLRYFCASPAAMSPTQLLSSIPELKSITPTSRVEPSPMTTPIRLRDSWPRRICTDMERMFLDRQCCDEHAIRDQWSAAK
jgi:hypothetical protein